jgi:aerobic carbon-monoxide dehydrogenase medium subunit
MHNFELVKPTTVEEAVAALQGDDAQPLSGGQTLIPTMKQRLAGSEQLISLTGIASMKGVTISGSTITIGGATTHATVSAEVAATYPALSALAGRIGDPAVRNRGTIGGSVANNDPAACYPSAVLASGATVITNSREIAADDFFQGMFATDLEEGEIITAVRFPVPEKASYQKFEQPASRFSLVGVFVAKFADGVRVAVTGAGEEGVFRWAEAEAALSANFSAAAVEALDLPSEALITDLHGTAEYRAHLIKVLTKRGVNEAV